MLLASCQPDKSTYTHVRTHARHCLYLPIANNGNVLRTKSNNRLGCSMRIRLACVSTFFPNRCLVDFVSTNKIFIFLSRHFHIRILFLSCLFLNFSSKEIDLYLVVDLIRIFWFHYETYTRHRRIFVEMVYVIFNRNVNDDLFILLSDEIFRNSIGKL